MRVAIYYAPPVNDTLWERGCHWLGRDADAERAVPQPDIPGIAELTAEARVYGFHATLKPPMTLRPGASLDAVITAAEDLAAGIAPFPLPHLDVADLHGFLALRDAEPSAALQALCDACVRELDHFRLPPSEAELARRRRPNFTPAHEAMLRRWGYPYVFDTWFFHMTLTRKLSDAERAEIMPRAQAHFADTLRAHRMVRDICVFVQETPGADFSLEERLPLKG